MMSVARKISKKFFGKNNNLPVIEKQLNHKLIDKNAINIIKTLNIKGFDAYLVGGCIRDILLGVKSKDFDIATNATPKQIHKIFKRSRIIGRRFQIVHILFGRNDFIEVATFRDAENNTKMIKNDNTFGDIKTDAKRRDLTINALYYNPLKGQIIDLENSLQDIENKKIQLIGDANLRFSQDPVRILRAIRFSVKLDFKINSEVKKAIFENKHLLKNIPAARFFEESLKLFHNTKSYQTFDALNQFGVLQYLFPSVKDNGLIKIALKNTADRIKKNQGVSPAFVFAIFLYDDYLRILAKPQKGKKPHNIIKEDAANKTIINQVKFVSIPKFISEKVKNTWKLQDRLLDEKNQENPDLTKKILQSRDFRMAYDFLVMLSNSTNPELKEAADFWKKIQK